MQVWNDPFKCGLLIDSHFFHDYFSESSDAFYIIAKSIISSTITNTHISLFLALAQNGPHHFTNHVISTSKSELVLSISNHSDCFIRAD